jgi:hypothetical protein
MPRSGGSSSGGSRSYGGGGDYGLGRSNRRYGSYGSDGSRRYGSGSDYGSGGLGYGGSTYSEPSTRRQSTIYTPPKVEPKTQSTFSVPQPPQPPPPVNPGQKISPKTDTKPDSAASTTSTTPTITQSASSGFGFGFGQIWGLNMGHLIFGRPRHTHSEPEIKKEADEFDPKYLDCARIEDMYLSTSNPDKQLRTAYAKCRSSDHTLHGV